MSISNRKVVIVGAGHVGSHVGYALISQSLALTPITQRQSHRRST